MNRKRILFVDDELNVIEGLKRMLRTYRFQWDMEFAHTGAEALAKMAELPFDVVVSDVQIPGMNGAELLERVAAGYPNVARIVLSGHAHEATTRRVAQVAHQYLSKPTTAEALVAALKRACEIQASVCTDAIRSTLAGCGSLPSLPTLYVEIVQASRSENTDAARIAKIISGDMAMSAKILQLVNSSFFGLGRRVSSIEYAVTLLGIVRVKALVLSEHIFKGFRPATRSPWLDVDELWQHSAAVAEVARRISRAEKQEGDRPDQAFTAGLLHDVGLLLLASHMPDRFEAAMDAAQTDPRPLHQIETELLGASHAHIGGYLLGLWGLPPRIVEAVNLHHCPSLLSYDGLCAVTCVHVADALVQDAFWLDPVTGRSAEWSPVDQTYLDRIALTSRLDTWRALAAEVCQDGAGGGPG